MRRFLSLACLGLIPLVLAACGKVDFDVPLSDDATSILDTRLIGIWQIVSPRENKIPGCVVVGKKAGSKNTLALSIVGIGNDLSIASQQMQLFAGRGEHCYLSISNDPATTTTVGARWSLVRYDFAADGTVHVRPINYNAFRALVRQQLVRGNLKGTLEGRRRRGDWVFSLPGHEVERLHFADSGQALIALLDAHAEECLEPTAIVFKRMETDAKIAVPPLKQSLPGETAVKAVPSPQKIQSPGTRPDEWAPELLQSFEVAAAFHRPAPYTSGKLEAFRSVALRLPWVYALDRTGTLCIFHVDQKGALWPQTNDAIPPVFTVQNAGDGADLKIFDNVLACTDSGGLKAYNLDAPTKPRFIGRFGPKQRPQSALSIVRHGNTAYLVGGRTIECYDLTRPAEPMHIGTFNAKRFVIGGAAAGHCVYLAVAERAANGIATFNVSDPAHPVEVCFTPTAQIAYALFATPDGRLIASLDADGDLHMANESYITVDGHSALYSLTDPEHPKLVKSYGQSGGRTSACLCIDGRCFLVCHGVVFAVERDGLEPDTAFVRQGSTMDGFAYHGDADGNYAALAADSAVMVLRRRGSK